MAWDNSHTWTLGELVTPTLMTTYVKDNLQYLYDRVPNYATVELDFGADLTTTSTSFTDAGTAQVEIDLTINYAVAKIGFNCTVFNATGITFIDLAVDGTRQGGTDGISRSTASNVVSAIAFTRIVDGLSAASHNFKIQWKVTAGTGNMYTGAGTSNADVIPQFWVEEVIQ